MAKTALMPLILSLAGTALGHALADLSPLASLAVAGALLLGYWGLLAVTSRPRTVSTSTRGRALLGVGALVAMALTALATFVANFSLLGLALVLALLVLALVLLRVADTSSAGGLLPIGALGLAGAIVGAALGIALPPLAGYAAEPRANLSVVNNCDTPLEYGPPLELHVPANGSGSAQVPSVAVDVTLEQDSIVVGAASSAHYTVPLQRPVALAIDHRPLHAGQTQRVDFQGGAAHELEVTCL